MYDIDLDNCMETDRVKSLVNDLKFMEKYQKDSEIGLDIYSKDYKGFRQKDYSLLYNSHSVEFFKERLDYIKHFKEISNKLFGK